MITKNKKNNRSGNALLLAMLIMGSIITVSTATSRLIMNEVKQSIQLDKAAVSFYAAESGIERALFLIRKKNFSATEIESETDVLDNSAFYNYVTRDYENILYTSLEEDEVYQVDLFQPDSLDPIGNGNGIRSLQIEWDGSYSLEVRWYGWRTSGSLDNFGNQITGGGYFSHDIVPSVIQLENANNYLYRVRIIARGGPANNIQITAYDNINPVSGSQMPIPGRIAIKAVGEFPNMSSEASRQSILVSMPQKSPLLGYYDYVLFSEEEIKKEN